MPTMPIIPHVTCRSRLVHASLIALALVVAAGCSAAGQQNPAFNVNAQAAHAAIKDMRAEKCTLKRPVFVLGGIHDPGFVSEGLSDRLRHLFKDDPVIIPVSFVGCDDFDECRERFTIAVLETLEFECTGDHDHTHVNDVDVIAFSMGGLIARYAAIPRTDGEPHVNIRTLYTVSTPHRGAELALFPTSDQRTIDMRPGSAFLAMLDRAWDPNAYELISYVRLGDAVIGSENATAPDGSVYWLPNLPLSFPHLWACRDPRIVGDIARRLRDDEPLTCGPPTPFPK